ncbi:MAG: nucleoside transporter C-terminal domain-containing protein [Candidatus Babeliales bacterium]
MFCSVSNYFTQSKHLLSILGIFIFLLTAFIFSNNKKKINWLKILNALIMQVILAFFILKTQMGSRIFMIFANCFALLYKFADAGISFLFGGLANQNSSWGFIFVVKVLPILIFLSSIMSILFHFGVIQFLVKIISYVIRPILGTSGVETLCVAANSMVGPTGAPLLVKKYIKQLTNSEIMVLMVSGMATINAASLAIYGSMGVSTLHMLVASIMSIPGVLLISKILVPETEKPQTLAGNKIEMQSDSSNVLDAITIGAIDGLKLAASVSAILLAFISLMAMADYVLLNTIGYSLNFIFSKIFYQITALLGIGAQDRSVAGALLGQKLVINEFVAYAAFVKSALTEHSKIILTYALCGFSNFSVIGMLIGAIAILAPEKRVILTKFGLRALLGATLVNLLNAAIASLLI